MIVLNMEKDSPHAHNNQNANKNHSEIKFFNFSD